MCGDALHSLWAASSIITLHMRCYISELVSFLVGDNYIPLTPCASSWRRMLWQLAVWMS